MRWEKGKGLPIHRIPGGQRQAVYAYSEELDAWLANSSPTESPTVQMNGSSAPGNSSLLRLKFSIWAITTIVVLILFLAGVIIWRSGSAMAVRVSFAQNRITAWDAWQRKAWEYKFPEGTVIVESSRPEASRQFIDLKGDGTSELLTVVHLSHQPDNGVSNTEMDCFSASGQLMWRYEPAASFTFGEQIEQGPWSIVDFLVVPDKPKSYIWVAVTDSMWGHSFVERVDSDSGHGEIRYVNNGTIGTLRTLGTPFGSLLLVSGYNNEYDRPMLAVLNQQQNFAVAPQTPGTRFFCGSCAQGTPLQYFLMPRSELNSLQNAGAPDIAYRMALLDDKIRVETDEVSDSITAYYFFSEKPEIRPVSFSLSSTYWSMHRRLEREGRIHHAAEQCPDHVYPKKLRMWTPGEGWSEWTTLYSPKGEIPEK
jgi:hypothetical protein